MKHKNSYDFYLIIATTVVLFMISLLCIYGMFYFKIAEVQQMPVPAKTAYMNRMNGYVSPFIISLILLLGICVPKRILPAAWLNRFAVVLGGAALAVVFRFGFRTGLLLVLCASLLLQLTVLVLAVAGSKRLHFEKKGYWLRLGSSLTHLGLILFILDLFLYEKQALHLVLFWITTFATLTGMTFCFYSKTVADLVKGKSRVA